MGRMRVWLCAAACGGIGGAGAAGHRGSRTRRRGQPKKDEKVVVTGTPEARAAAGAGLDDRRHGDGGRADDRVPGGRRDDHRGLDRRAGCDAGLRGQAAAGSRAEAAGQGQAGRGAGDRADVLRRVLQEGRGGRAEAGDVSVQRRAGLGDDVAAHGLVRSAAGGRRRIRSTRKARRTGSSTTITACWMWRTWCSSTRRARGSAGSTARTRRRRSGASTRMRMRLTASSASF